MNQTQREYYTWATLQLEHLRGAALNLSTDMEMLVGEMIALHFCGEKISPKKNEFIAVIINNRDITFSSMIAMLQDILKNSYSGIDKSVLNRVDKFRSYRNKYAHCRLDTSSKSLAEICERRDIVRLTEIKGRDVITHDYDVKTHKKKLEDYRELIDDLLKLREQMKKGANSTSSLS